LRKPVIGTYWVRQTQVKWTPIASRWRGEKPHESKFPMIISVICGGGIWRVKLSRRMKCHGRMIVSAVID
jgi:hypothetical protein